MDSDLNSIQQARDLVKSARKAQKQWANSTQADVDLVCEAMASAAYQSSELLGQMACEETGYGVPIHKTLKNHLSSKILWDAIKDTKTVGVIRQDLDNRVYDIAWPIGLIAALTPSTNPTSTVMFKILIATKARNAIVIAPHPASVQCCAETAAVMAKAGEAAGAPSGLIGCMTEVTLAGTQELMQHEDTSMILATGGSEMVKAAHSVGKPAYGVGPGNVPCYVDRSANVERAARYIVASKSFDYSVICATEQSVVVDQPIAGKLASLMENQGAYFMNDQQAVQIANVLFFPDGGTNSQAVGKSPQKLAEMADISVPDSARILVARLNKVGQDEPLSKEKLTTVLGWYETDGWELGCQRCIELINFGGRGHSLVIHSDNDDVIMAFGLEKPVFRIVVNTMGTMGTTGMTTGLTPSMTLGSGGIGGSITGDNIGVEHMFNIKRLAYETCSAPDEAMGPGGDLGDKSLRLPTDLTLNNHNQVSQVNIEAIVDRVMNEI